MNFKKTVKAKKLRTKFLSITKTAIRNLCERVVFICACAGEEEEEDIVPWVWRETS
jgi:hypothetical protein